MRSFFYGKSMPFAMLVAALAEMRRIQLNLVIFSRKYNTLTEEEKMRYDESKIKKMGYAWNLSFMFFTIIWLIVDIRFCFLYAYAAAFAFLVADVIIGAVLSRTQHALDLFCKTKSNTSSE